MNRLVKKAPHMKDFITKSMTTDRANFMKLVQHHTSVSLNKEVMERMMLQEGAKWLGHASHIQRGNSRILRQGGGPMAPSHYEPSMSLWTLQKCLN